MFFHTREGRCGLEAMSGRRHVSLLKKGLPRPRGSLNGEGYIFYAAGERQFPADSSRLRNYKCNRLNGRVHCKLLGSMHIDPAAIAFGRDEDAVVTALDHSAEVGSSFTTRAFQISGATHSRQSHGDRATDGAV